jgi:hypothetical protein
MGHLYAVAEEFFMLAGEHVRNLLQRHHHGLVFYLSIGITLTIKQFLSCIFPCRFVLFYGKSTT